MFVDRDPSGCGFNFEWVTPAACPLRLVKGSACAVTDPVTGTVFDLTPLRFLPSTTYACVTFPCDF